MKRSPARNPKPGNPAAAVDFAAIARELATLPERAPDPRANTTRYLIERLREPLLDAMVCRHQSPATLAELLGRWGIAIRPDTLRRYLGPIAPPRRPAAPPTDPPPTAEPSRAGRTAAAASERPGAGAAGSPEALARPEAALAEAPMPSAGPPARPTPPLSSRFVPKPELPYDELIRRSEAQKAQTP